MRCHFRPAAKRAGITKHVTWHAFRHSFSTLLVANDNDVKTVQHLLRHANRRITLELYTGAVDDKVRKAQSQGCSRCCRGEQAWQEWRQMPERKALYKRSMSLLVYRKNYMPC